MSSPIRDFSPGHWKIVVQNDASVRVEPSGYLARTGCVALVFAALSIFACVYPSIEFGVRVALATSGLLIGAAVVALSWWEYAHEREQGPYLKISKTGFQIRDHADISFADFKSFEVRATQECLGDGWQWVYSLILICKDEKEFEIVASVIKREAIKLKRKLDEQLPKVLDHRPRDAAV